MIPHSVTHSLDFTGHAPDPIGPMRVLGGIVEPVGDINVVVPQPTYFSGDGSFAFPVWFSSPVRESNYVTHVSHPHHANQHDKENKKCLSTKTTELFHRATWEITEE